MIIPSLLLKVNSQIFQPCLKWDTWSQMIKSLKRLRIDNELYILGRCTFVPYFRFKPESMSSTCDDRKYSFTASKAQIDAAHLLLRRLFYYLEQCMNCVSNIHSINVIPTIARNGKVRIMLKSELAYRLSIQFARWLIRPIGAEKS